MKQVLCIVALALGISLPSFAQTVTLVTDGSLTNNATDTYSSVSYQIDCRKASAVAFQLSFYAVTRTNTLTANFERSLDGSKWEALPASSIAIKPTFANTAGYITNTTYGTVITNLTSIGATRYVRVKNIVCDNSGGASYATNITLRYFLQEDH